MLAFYGEGVGCKQLVAVDDDPPIWVTITSVSGGI